jgi:hypothetical protein
MTSNLDCVTSNPATSGTITMTGSPVPNVSFISCFDTITTISAKPFKLKGGLPLGGSYSGPGVNSISGIFTPSLAGTGLKTIQYAYTNMASCSVIAHSSLLILLHLPAVITSPISVIIRFIPLFKSAPNAGCKQI